MFKILNEKNLKKFKRITQLWLFHLKHGDMYFQLTLINILQ